MAAPRGTSHNGMQVLLGQVLTEEKPRKIRLKAIDNVDETNQRFKGQFTLVSDSDSSVVDPPRQSSTLQRSPPAGMQRATSQHDRRSLLALGSEAQDDRHDEFWQPEYRGVRKAREQHCTRGSRGSVQPGASPEHLDKNPTPRDSAAGRVKPRHSDPLGDRLDDLAPRTHLADGQVQADGNVERHNVSIQVTCQTSVQQLGPPSTHASRANAGGGSGQESRVDPVALRQASSRQGDGDRHAVGNMDEGSVADRNGPQSELTADTHSEEWDADSHQVPHVDGTAVNVQARTQQAEGRKTLAGGARHACSVSEGSHQESEVPAVPTSSIADQDAHRHPRASKAAGQISHRSTHCVSESAAILQQRASRVPSHRESRNARSDHQGGTDEEGGEGRCSQHGTRPITEVVQSDTCEHETHNTVPASEVGPFHERTDGNFTHLADGQGQADGDPHMGNRSIHASSRTSLRQPGGGGSSRESSADSVAPRQARGQRDGDRDADGEVGNIDRGNEANGNGLQSELTTNTCSETGDPHSRQVARVDGIAVNARRSSHQARASETARAGVTGGGYAPDQSRMREKGCQRGSSRPEVMSGNSDALAQAQVPSGRKTLVGGAHAEQDRAASKAASHRGTWAGPDVQRDSEVPSCSPEALRTQQHNCSIGNQVEEQQCLEVTGQEGQGSQRTSRRGSQRGGSHHGSQCGSQCDSQARADHEDCSDSSHGGSGISVAQPRPSKRESHTQQRTSHRSSTKPRDINGDERQKTEGAEMELHCERAPRASIHAGAGNSDKPAQGSKSQRGSAVARIGEGHDELQVSQARWDQSRMKQAGCRGDEARATMLSGNIDAMGQAEIPLENRKTTAGCMHPVPHSEVPRRVTRIRSDNSPQQACKETKHGSPDRQDHREAGEYGDILQPPQRLSQTSTRPSTSGGDGEGVQGHLLRGSEVGVLQTPGESEAACHHVEIDHTTRRGSTKEGQWSTLQTNRGSHSSAVGGLAMDAGKTQQSARVSTSVNRGSVRKVEASESNEEREGDDPDIEGREVPTGCIEDDHQQSQMASMMGKRPNTKVDIPEAGKEDAAGTVPVPEGKGLSSVDNTPPDWCSEDERNVLNAPEKQVSPQRSIVCEIIETQHLVQRGSVRRKTELPPSTEQREVEVTQEPSGAAGGAGEELPRLLGSQPAGEASATAGAKSAAPSRRPTRAEKAGGSELSSSKASDGARARTALDAQAKDQQHRATVLRGEAGGRAVQECVSNLAEQRHTTRASSLIKRAGEQHAAGAQEKEDLGGGGGTQLLRRNTPMSGELSQVQLDGSASRRNSAVANKHNSNHVRNAGADGRSSSVSVSESTHGSSSKAGSRHIASRSRLSEDSASPKKLVEFKEPQEWDARDYEIGNLAQALLEDFEQSEALEEKKLDAGSGQTEEEASQIERETNQTQRAGQVEEAIRATGKDAVQVLEEARGGGSAVAATSRQGSLQRRPTPHPRSQHGVQPRQSAAEQEGVATQRCTLVVEEETLSSRREPGKPTYCRADCRFTLEDLPLFVGIDAHPTAAVSFDDATMVPIRGAERTRLLVLLEHADSAVDAVRGARASRVDAVALELPGLLRDLSAAFVLHMRGIPEPSGLTDLDGVPTALAVLVRLVEVLDILVAPEEDSMGERQRGRRSRGGDAADLISGFGERSDNAVAALGGGLGPRGFLPPCLDCLGDGQARARLEGTGAHEFARELAVHALLAVRLVLCWTPPLGVPRPCDVLLAIGGHSKLLSAASDFQSRLRGSSSAKRQSPMSPKVTVGLGQLALTLDALRLSLRSDACVDKLLSSHGQSSSIFGAFARGPRSSSVSGAGLNPIAPLAPLAVEALEHLTLYRASEQGGGDTSSKVAGLAVDASVTAAVRLLAVLVDLPIVAASAPPHRIAQSLKKILEVQPLSLRFTNAIRQLVCWQRRSRGWFGDSGTGFHRQLRCALAAENVPSECVHAALRALDNGHIAKPPKGDGERKSVAAEVTACGERLVMAATLYESVEVIACAVHGLGAASEEDMAELRLRCDESAAASSPQSSHGSPGGGGEEEEPPPARRSLRANLGSLRGKIRETCIAPYVK